MHYSHSRMILVRNLQESYLNYPSKVFLFATKDSEMVGRWLPFLRKKFRLLKHSFCQWGFLGGTLNYSSPEKVGKLWSSRCCCLHTRRDSLHDSFWWLESGSQDSSIQEGSFNRAISVASGSMLVMYIFCGWKSKSLLTFMSTPGLDCVIWVVWWRAVKRAWLRVFTLSVCTVGISKQMRAQMMNWHRRNFSWKRSTFRAVRPSSWIDH